MKEFLLVVKEFLLGVGVVTLIIILIVFGTYSADKCREEIMEKMFPDTESLSNYYQNKTDKLQIEIANLKAGMERMRTNPQIIQPVKIILEIEQKRAESDVTRAFQGYSFYCLPEMIIEDEDFDKLIKGRMK